ncbi:MAG: GNAT family N-acetyltransferase [Burkholderiales bacterium]
MSLNARAMSDAEVEDAFDLLRAFLSTDRHYLDSRLAYGDGGEDALRSALRLFLAHPELGFVWLVYESGVAVACCVACYAISTSAGAVVVKLDDVAVAPGREGQGIGTMLIDSLKRELRGRGVRRIDTSCHVDNARARSFYVRHGFRPLNEERLAHVL